VATRLHGTRDDRVRQCDQLNFQSSGCQS
jgi:hypothetical protein